MSALFIYVSNNLNTQISANNRVSPEYMYEGRDLSFVFTSKTVAQLHAMRCKNIRWWYI